MTNAVQGAPVAHKPAPSRATKLNKFVMLGSALLLALTMAAVEAPAVAAHDISTPARGSQAALILQLTKQAVGHPFRMGTEGPQYFDCSGLVWSVYKRAGLVSRIGGVRRGATGYLRWAQPRGLVSLRNLRPGDLIAWGDHGRVRHIGIYIGGDRAISALNPKLGVRNHPIGWIHMRILGYVHTQITR